MSAIFLIFINTQLLSQYCEILCQHKNCQWGISSSPFISFLIRDAHPHITPPIRPGWYHKNPDGNLELISEIREPNSFKWATTQVIDAAIFAQATPDNIFISIFARFGMAHVLCVSAWHVGQIKKQKLPFPVVLLLLLSLLKLTDYSFPLLRAVIATILPQKKCLEIWSLSWLIALTLSPFAWQSWSFWLSLYYSVLFFYTQPQHLLLRLSNIFWIALWGMELDLLTFIVGGVSEPFFMLLLLLSWLSYAVSLVYPDIVELFWNGIFQYYLDYTLISITLPLIRLPTLFAFLLFFFMQARNEIIFFNITGNIKNITIKYNKIGFFF